MRLWPLHHAPLQCGLTPHQPMILLSSAISLVTSCRRSRSTPIHSQGASPGLLESPQRALSGGTKTSPVRGRGAEWLPMACGPSACRRSAPVLRSSHRRSAVPPQSQGTSLGLLKSSRQALSDGTRIFLVLGRGAELLPKACKLVRSHRPTGAGAPICPYHQWCRALLQSLEGTLSSLEMPLRAISSYTRLLLVCRRGGFITNTPATAALSLLHRFGITFWSSISRRCTSSFFLPPTPAAFGSSAHSLVWNCATLAGLRHRPVLLHACCREALRCATNTPPAASGLPSAVLNHMVPVIWPVARHVVRTSGGLCSSYSLLRVPHRTFGCS